MRLILETLRYSSLTMLVLTLKYFSNKVNTMTADALAPCIARASTTMVSTMEDKRVLVFHEEAFQLPAPCQLNLQQNILSLK